MITIAKQNALFLQEDFFFFIRRFVLTYNK